MASSTRQSLASAKEAIKPLLAQANLAAELFAVSNAIAGSAQLRNLLSDPSAEVKAKAGAASAVFAKSVSAETLNFVTALVALRWSKGSDLVSALEQLGVHAAASAAAGNGSVEQLSNELFAFQQAIETNSELQFALAAKSASNEQRASLVSKLLAGKASALGELVIQQAVVHAGKRRASLVLDAFGKLVAEVANNLVATVTVAQELSADQQTRLQAALAKQYGTNIKLNIEHDATIIGGVRVQIADQIIDGSLASRLNQARLSLA